jgi:hypothetical protein
VEPARWYTVRRAQSRKPATYKCPFCGRLLPALSEHVLVMAEGDPSTRRHAHTACAVKRRKAGRLPTQAEWRATQPRAPGLLAQLRARLRR